CRRLSFGFPSALDAQPMATEDWPVVVVCLQDFCWRGLQRNRAPSPVIAVIGEGFCHRSQTTAIRIDGYDFCVTFFSWTCGGEAFWSSCSNVFTLVLLRSFLL